MASPAAAARQRRRRASGGGAQGTAGGGYGPAGHRGASRPRRVPVRGGVVQGGYCAVRPRVPLRPSPGRARGTVYLYGLYMT